MCQWTRLRKCCKICIVIFSKSTSWVEKETLYQQEPRVEPAGWKGDTEPTRTNSGTSLVERRHCTNKNQPAMEPRTFCPWDDSVKCTTSVDCNTSTIWNGTKIFYQDLRTRNIRQQRSKVTWLVHAEDMRQHDTWGDAEMLTDVCTLGWIFSVFVRGRWSEIIPTLWLVKESSGHKD